MQIGNSISFESATRDSGDFGSTFARSNAPPIGTLVYQKGFCTDNTTDRTANFSLETGPNSKWSAKGIVYSVKKPSLKVAPDNFFGTLQGNHTDPKLERHAKRHVLTLRRF